MDTIEPRVEIKTEPVEVKREIDEDEQSGHFEATPEDFNQHKPESESATACVSKVKLEIDPSDPESDDPEYAEQDDETSSEGSDDQPQDGVQPPQSTPSTKDSRKYACNECDKTYSTVGYLLRHQKVCKSQFPCRQCEKSFTSAQVLRYHLNEHTGERPYVCRQTEGCGEAFAHPRLRVLHEQECGGGPVNQESTEPDEVYIDGVKRFICSKCGKPSKTSGLFRRHKRLCHGLRNCNICAKVFKDPLELKYHMNLHSGDKPFQCQKNCSESFHSPRHRMRHEKLCGLPEQGRQNEGEEDPSKGFGCKICGKRYANWGFLLRHQRLHNPTKTLTCDLCSQEFKTTTQLRYHLNKHNGDKPFPCRREGCDEAFVNPARRFDHEGSCGKTGQFRCDVCNLAASSIKDLRVHQLTHKKHADKDKNASPVLTGNMVFLPMPSEEGVPADPSKIIHVKAEQGTEDQSATPVESVSQSFSVVHEKTSGKAKDSKSDGKKPSKFTCEHCGKSYNSLGFALRHKQICNNPSAFPMDVLRCDFCPATFHKSNKLRLHLNEHTGEKPYKCRGVGCEAAFESPHKRFNHENLRCTFMNKDCQLSCTVCGSQFNNKYLLKKHMEKHADKDRDASPVLNDNIPTPPEEGTATIIHVKVEPGYEDQSATSIESAAQSFPCPQCKKNFASAGVLKFHQEHCVKPCHLCSATFLTKQELTSHLKIHRNENPFKCRLEPCDDRFPDSRARVDHEKTCDKAKVSASDVKKKSSGKITCEHCGKSYTSQGFALRHKQLCNNPSAFPMDILRCHFCPATFHQSTKLRLHLNEHTGETPYKCRGVGCEAAFESPQKRLHHEYIRCPFMLKMPLEKKTVAPKLEISIEATTFVKQERPDEEIMGM